ncbi:MAG: DNA repair and recombination protein RadB [Candidatus Undinarchaeales archaeon]
MNIFKKEEKEEFDLKPEAIPTGCTKLDKLIGDGLQTKILSHVYGKPGSGKTNLCISTAIECAKLGRKVAYIDTEGGFNYVRLRQMCKDDDLINKIVIAQPKSFEEQLKLVKRLPKLLNTDFSLVVLDSAVSLYRLNVNGSREDIIKFSRKLAKQAAWLTQLASEKKVAVIATNHVYDSFNKKGVSPVGGDTLMYWSKMILNIEKKRKNRKASLVKHPFMPDGKSIKFRITNSGLE